MREASSVYLYILTPNITSQNISTYTRSEVQHATLSPTRSCTHVLYDLQTIGPYKDHGFMATWSKTTSWMSCPVVWLANHPAALRPPKNVIPH